MQRIRKKRGGFLLSNAAMEDEKVMRLLEGSLHREEFDELVRNWVDKGVHWSKDLKGKKISKGLQFRTDFVSSLDDKKETWRELIEIATRGIEQDEQEDILNLLRTDAGGNPLRLLN